jgi:hypothetical protein
MWKRFLIIIIILLATPVVVLAKIKSTLESYLEPFYNRYSLQFDRYGLVYATPDYGVKKFEKATSARARMSLATYYRYRATVGNKSAQIIIRKSIDQANASLDSRLSTSYSFEDAAAQFLMWQMLDDIPLGYSAEQKKYLKTKIVDRAVDGLKAKDTENRAVLSAVYWQAIVNWAHQDRLITSYEKTYFDEKIKNKIDEAVKGSIDANGWYLEGSPQTFNPHYHLVTAFSLMVYGDLVNDKNYSQLAKTMTNNLRQVSFSNGMVEARLGPRPVGLGAQFYLGAGLLNWRFGFSDYGAYLNFARGNRFFSDPKYPNRLEYHSTRVGTAPNFHDDYAFSNLAELALATPFFKSQELKLSTSLKVKVTDPEISNTGQVIIYNHKKITLQPNKISTKVIENYKNLNKKY